MHLRKKCVSVLLIIEKRRLQRIAKELTKTHKCVWNLSEKIAMVNEQERTNIEKLIPQKTD